ncbi:MAG TPA: flagellar export protein FliJ [Steroidobacteraceae bacterium]|mgnify:FL=1|nr:flagellar export protein FliJ [Steroidobacteraceae bacterium]HQW08916.1 flagellar export protein FliJ [Steroidobacteraceae bacterium]HQX77763.1 flagellar export protein FliJ [Steroidobacteraceae bacterium]HQZ79681.1 flagellar export protein FliJ [Steroidobacteraceae bacterium]
MTRSKRLRPVVRAVGHDERDCAARLAQAQRRALEAEQRRVELAAWQENYANGLAGRVAAGISAAALRDYRAFLARLGEALRAQGRVATQARTEQAVAHEAWRLAAQRAKSIDQVVVRLQSEERAASERLDQAEADELARELVRTRERHP